MDTGHTYAVNVAMLGDSFVMVRDDDIWRQSRPAQVRTVLSSALIGMGLAAIMITSWPMGAAVAATGATIAVANSMQDNLRQRFDTWKLVREVRKAGIKLSREQISALTPAP